jgi:BirA family transcriptional regulator, biotin operon repressor / biotin---[acetyl-CoA-carboxylase] ligase
VRNPLDLPATRAALEELPAEALRSRWGVPVLRLHRSVGSTNDLARALAEQGAPAGATVLAREQVAGRGRAGRPWSSAADRGLWMSMVARPDRRTLPGVLPLLAGLVVARALDGFLHPGAVGLKWPNDLVIGTQKLGGVLCEAAWAGETPQFAVVGVGINVLQTSDEFPPELRDQAISLRAAGASIDTVAAVADRVVPAMLRAVGGPVRLDHAALAEIAARDVLLGAHVQVFDPVTGQPGISGTAEGIDPGGALRLRDAAGTTHAVHGGTIRRIDEPHRSR